LINKAINVDNGGEFIGIGELLTNMNTEGLICVLSPEVNLSKYLDMFKRWFKCLYFQLDFVEWSNSTKDEQWLNSLKNYLTNHFQKVLQPILIPDAYYLEQKDHEIKKVLNNIGKVGFKNSSVRINISNQLMKYTIRHYHYSMMKM
jgi:hypothetical protein